jgi:oligogalacturonide transport system permease protein
MSKKTKKKVGLIITYAIVIIIGIAMIYPILFMFFASFKTNDEIFGSLKLLPNHFSLDAFIQGWKSTGVTTYTDYFVNTFLLVIPTTLLTVFSCSLAAYGFARFRFPGKKFLFALLIATLMLPNAVTIIPRYSMFNKWGWVDTYLPWYIQAALGVYPFFIFMLIQFMRGLPKELDESAYMDGCNAFRVYWNILLPLMKPALFSAGLFQFLWTYNDYLNPLIFINSVKKYVISLALRLSLDSESVVQWNQIMAMSFVAVLPLIILFFSAQKYFVEGIATTGMKN